jgi:hypothetical protein
MVKAKTLIEMKATGNHTPLPKSQTFFTPPKVITGAFVCFKRKKVSTPKEIDVPTSIIEAFVVAFPPP